MVDDLLLVGYDHNMDELYHGTCDECEQVSDKIRFDEQAYVAYCPGCSDSRPVIQWGSFEGEEENEGWI